MLEQKKKIPRDKTCRYPDLVLNVVHVHFHGEFLAQYSSTHARACHLFGSVSAQRRSTDAKSRGDCSYEPQLRRRRSYILSACVVQARWRLENEKTRVTPGLLRKFIPHIAPIILIAKSSVFRPSDFAHIFTDNARFAFRLNMNCKEF